MAKTKVNTTIEDVTEKEVRELAKEENRKFSNMVDTLLKEALKHRKNKNN